MGKKKTENIFEILGVREKETVHSNMLAWLLNPSESHGLGGVFIKKLLLAVKKDLARKIEKIDRSFDSFLVEREVCLHVNRKKRFVDILMKSEKAKIIICIENKVFSSEHTDQLTDYANYLEKEYSSKKDSYKLLFIYLTPLGENASDSRWKNFSYDDLSNVIKESALSGGRAKSVNPVVRKLINDYQETVNNVIQRGNVFVKYIVKSVRRLKNDFSTLQVVSSRSIYNVHLTDTSLECFAPSDKPGGYAKTKDLFYIDIKFEAEQRKNGVLACVLAFTNHPQNLAAGSCFRNLVKPENLKFRWYVPIKKTRKLLRDGESVDDFFASKDAENRIYNVVKKLLSEMDAELIKRKYKNSKRKTR